MSSKLVPQCAGLPNVFYIPGIWHICTSFIQDEIDSRFRGTCGSAAIDEVKYVWAFGADFENVRREVYKRFAIRCRFDCVDELRWLLGIGLSSEDIKRENDRAFTSACANGCEGVVKWLLEDVYKMLVPAPAIKAGVRLACRNGHVGVATQLWKLGVCTVDDLRAADNSLFIDACGEGYAPMVWWLLESGLTITDARSGGCNAWRIALQKHRAEVMRILKDIGAFPRKFDKIDSS